MHKLLQWLVAVVLVTTAVGCSEVRNFFRRDACLDRGGRWDYQKHHCQAEVLGTRYPRTYYPDNSLLWPAMQDEATRKKVLAHIDQLQPGDSSAVVVGKLGVPPLFYYDADSKNLQAVPTHYVINYYFFRDNNDGADTKSQYITLMFDKQERLTQIWYNQIPELDGRQLQVPLKNMQESFQQASP